MSTEQPLFRTIGSKARLVDRVAGEIEGEIVGGQLPPGTKLPAERELCEQLGVSRTVLREAVHILVARGLLETSPGVGTHVREPTSEQVTEPLNLLARTQSGGPVSFDHLHQVRSVLEVEIAALAAAAASEDEVAELDEILAAMETLRYEPIALADADANFHRTLARITHNPVLLILLNSIRQMLHDYIQTVTPYLDPDVDVLPLHYPIVAAVKAHDAAAAREAMRAHQRQMVRNFESMLQKRKTTP